MTPKDYYGFIQRLDERKSKTIQDFVRKNSWLFEYGENFHVGCGPGWHRVIKQTARELRPLAVAIAELGYEVKISQIKEKFGTMRFYVDTIYVGDGESPSNSKVDFIYDEIYRVIGAAEKATASICEYCGRNGSRDTTKYWLKTVCVNCKEMRNHG